jgi:outer membrane protein assembly factor BamB
MPRTVPAVLALALALTAADWPQFLGPTRDGVSAETGLATAWPADGPRRVWERPVGAGFSGPVVVGGRLVLFHRTGAEEVVECLEAATGKPLWRTPAPTDYVDDFGFDEGPRATPLVADGRVYTLGAAGRLACLTLGEGKPVWDRNVNADYQVEKGFFGVATSPILEGGRLVVNVGGREAGIVAFDPATGKEVWRATRDAASYSSPTAATLAGKRTVVFLTREGLVGLDPADGTVRFQKRWRARLHASVNAATPLVVGDQVFVSASYGTGAGVFEVAAGGLRELWANDRTLSSHYNTGVYRAGHLYGIDGRQEGGQAELRCVAWKTGKVVWSKEGFGCASLIVADGNLLALTERGELVLIAATPEGYQEKARAAVLTGPCRAVPALADGRLYARDTKKLVCFELKK